MLSKTQQERVARRCTSVVIQVIDALPDLLSKSEPEAAAAIVADLIKAGIALPTADESMTLDDFVNSYANRNPD